MKRRAEEIQPEAVMVLRTEKLPLAPLRRGPEGRPLNVAQPGRAGLASIMMVERRRRGTPNGGAQRTVGTMQSYLTTPSRPLSID
jgi:hypothetical protein